MVFSSTDLRTIRNRYSAHLESTDNHLLRPGQIQLGEDIVDFMSSKQTDGKESNAGYFVRPTGTGKTVSFIDFFIGANTLPSGKSVIGDMQQQKRSLVMVPWNFLLNQWEDELLGKLKDDGTREKSKFAGRILPENVGVYRAGDSYEKKQEALSKPIVLITYDAARMLATEEHDPEEPKTTTQAQRAVLKQMLKAENFPLVMLDEVHDRPHGDKTSEFLKEHYFGQSFVLGGTATHLYRNGHTVGDDLFGGQPPIHETTFVEAVNNKEIAPMRNILVETTLDEAQENELHDISEAAIKRARKKGATAEECDYTEKELERIVEITQRDEAAIRLLQRGRDPLTGKSYRDMKQVWYCASVKHAQSIAARLNEKMGEGYAVAVHGKMDDKEQDAVLINYKKGEHRALTNCQLLVHGFDDSEAELCMQLVPTRSPNRSMQQGGRVMRLNLKDKNKIANILTFIYPGIEQQIFGELAGGYIMIPADQQETISRSTTTANSEEQRVWPEIEGLKVRYTTDEITLFAEERVKSRYAKGLTVKTDNMCTVEEMARLLFPGLKEAKLADEIKRLQEKVYEPLQEAYLNRNARQKFVGLGNTSRSNVEMFVRGQRFPTAMMGEFNDNGKARFCIGKNASVLCRHALFGSIGKPPKGWINELSLAKTMRLNNEQTIKLAEVVEKIKTAYIDRKGYERVLHIPIDDDNSVNISLDTVSYFKRDGDGVGLYFLPDALIPLYQLVANAEEKTAKTWFGNHSTLKQLKTLNWLDKEDAISKLDLTTTSPEYADFNSWWEKFENAFNRAGNTVAGQEKTVTVRGKENIQRQVTAAKMSVIGSPTGRPEICLKSDCINDLREELGLEAGQIRNQNKRSIQ